MRFAGGSLFFVVCLILAVPSISHSDAGPHAQHRAFLELFVNGVDKGPVIVVMRGPEIIAPVDDLATAGLKSIGGGREEISGKKYVPLSSLAPAVTYDFDRKELALRLMVYPKLLGNTIVDVRALQPHGMVYLNSPSMFLNYALTAQNFNSYSLFTEAGLSYKGNLLYSSMNVTPYGEVIRGVTNLTIDNLDHLTRLMIGDTFANTGLLGGGTFIGGIGFSRDFALNPYFIPYPTQQVAGRVTMPSVADVYVNGNLVKQIQLQPGQFNLQNLPFPTGAGNTQVVIRNAFGQSQVINSPYYQSTAVLQPGLSQYTYNFGFLRSNYGSASWGYGPLAFAASHLYGFNNFVTGGGFLQLDSKVGVGGPQFALRTPVGQFGFSGAGSVGQRLGGSASASYTYLTQKWSFGSDITVTSRKYATLSLTPQMDRPLLQADASIGFQFRRMSIFPTVRYASYRDSGRTWSAGVINNYRLSSLMNLQFGLTKSYVQRIGPNLDIFLALNFFLGKTTVATTSYDQLRGMPGRSGLGTVQIQKSLPLGIGYGYLFQGQLGQSAQQVADLQYQGPYGLYEFDYSRLGGFNQEIVNIAGGLVGIGGHLFATRPVQDSYALIRVPEVDHVTGYYSNQSVGRTDHGGDLFVPNLLSYYGNELSINDHDIPIDYVIEANRRIVATPYRGGAVVTFPVHRLQAFTGKILVKSRQGVGTTPAFGDLTVTAQKSNEKPSEYKSPIGRHGEFYLENVPAGTWSATIDYQGGQCVFPLTLPSSEQRIVKMGTLACELQ